MSYYPKIPPGHEFAGVTPDGSELLLRKLPPTTDRSKYVRDTLCRQWSRRYASELDGELLSLRPVAVYLDPRSCADLTHSAVARNEREFSERTVDGARQQFWRGVPVYVVSNSAREHIYIAHEVA